MTREDFTSFDPPFDDPLVISFIDLARARGFQTEISFGFWDFYLYEDDDEPIIAVKTVKNKVTDATMERLVVDPTPFKVILLEGRAPAWKSIEAAKTFLAATGTGLYVRGVGWRTLPGEPAVDVVSDLQLKLAPRWRQDQDGIWRKQCTKCGERKTTDDFYPSAYKTSRDPYRNTCVKCFNAKKEAA